MNDALYITIDILIILFIFLMIIYLAYDRSRFQIERQFFGMKKTIMEYASGTEYFDLLKNTKTSYKKMMVLAECCSDPAFIELSLYFDIHNELAYKHNEIMQKGIFRGVAKLMGFKEYPIMRYSDQIVLNSRSGNRTTIIK